MDKFKHFLGIDVSKEYFDAVIILNSHKKDSIHAQFENNTKGVRKLHKWLEKNKAFKEETLVCLEHTGLYGKIIITQLLALGYSLWVEMSLKIIRSVGVQRGKNDKVDAERIAYFAMKNVDEATIFRAPRKPVEAIRTLLSVREKLITTKTTLQKNIKELEIFDKELAKISSKSLKNTLKGIEKDLKDIETQIDEIVKEDENLSRIFRQATSVPGVGKITTLFLICFTNEFTAYSTPRQLACYCGVVPFEYTSGKSIRAKPKVHYMANKTLKKHLHMCALSAKTYDPEMKEYFERKVEEGKNKMLVINNVRNKLVHRICACIRDNREFIKKIS